MPMVYAAGREMRFAGNVDEGKVATVEGRGDDGSDDWL